MDEKDLYVCGASLVVVVLLFWFGYVVGKIYSHKEIEDQENKQ